MATRPRVSKTAKATPAVRQRRSRQDIQNRILRAATTQFSQHGFSRTTTASIARQADVTEAQIFRHFVSKSGLFREAIFKPLDQHLLKFLVSQAKQDPKKIGIKLYTSELQRFVTEHSEMFTSLLMAQKYDPDSTREVSDINSLSAYFEHGAASMKQLMSSRPKLDPKLMVRVSFAAVLGCVTFRDWVFPPGLATSKEITAAITEFIFQGVSSNYD